MVSKIPLPITKAGANALNDVALVAVDPDELCWPITVDEWSLAIVFTPIAVEAHPLAVVPPPIAVDAYPLAVVNTPIAVEDSPLAFEACPIAVEVHPLAVGKYPIAVEYPPVAPLVVLAEIEELKSTALKPISPWLLALADASL